MYEKLADIFDAVGVKYLTAVDVKKENSKSKGSNQHEIGGLIKAGFGEYLGLPSDGYVRTFKASMVYIFPEQEEPVVCEDEVSWYDTRYNDKSRSPEYRLYYKKNAVTELFSEGDFFLIAITKDKNLLMVFTPQGSMEETQLQQLFGASGVVIQDSLKKVVFQSGNIVLPIRTMLSHLGIELYASRKDDADLLSDILENFGDSFPNTKKFSDYARGIVEGDIDVIEDPDGALIAWVDEEEHLFRLLERHIVSVKLAEGFGDNGDNVDEFVKFSLSVQNRRKSRAGHAFENHIERILFENGVSFERGGKTEGKQTPDFLFPGSQLYHDMTFDVSKLRMLGAKTSCKDRWRQVLAEAKKINRKHLITMEPAISQDQTEQMAAMNLQLVVPEVIQSTYAPSQVQSLMTLKSFIREVKSL